MQPGAERVPHPEPTGLLEQDQERRLERVIRVVRISQHVPADAKHHGAMPLDQGGESQLGGLTMTRREPFQDLSVGQITNASEMEERPDLSLNGAVLSGRHGSVLQRTAISKT